MQGIDLRADGGHDMLRPVETGEFWTLIETARSRAGEQPD